VLKLVDGLSFEVAGFAWNVPPLRLDEGQWIALQPDRPEPEVDPTTRLSRILVTLTPPLMGTVEILGKDVYRMDYLPLQRLRPSIGFVHGYGGLLSNRTVRENIALPLSIHGGLSAMQEDEAIERTLEDFRLSRVAHLQPHEMDGATRWRVCLARALVLEPKLVVLEGIGNWEMDRGRGRGWSVLMERHLEGRHAIAVCMARQHPEFEDWIVRHKGEIVRYTKFSDSIVPTRSE
jgi:ABC-type ATPase involved in cell division